MPDPFPFVYQCRQCGAVQRVTRGDVSGVVERKRPRFTADAVLREVYDWAQARPDSVCPTCSR
jgi:rubrerythrin